jgi:hypothetical protein
MKGKATSRLTRSIRRHIRREKAKIRGSAADPEERDRRIAELYSKFGVTVHDYAR